MTAGEIDGLLGVAMPDGTVEGRVDEKRVPGDEFTADNCRVIKGDSLLETTLSWVFSGTTTTFEIHTKRNEINNKHNLYLF